MKDERWRKDTEKEYILKKILKRRKEKEKGEREKRETKNETDLVAARLFRSDAVHIPRR